MHKFKRYSWNDKAFYIITILILTIFFIMVLYPCIFVVSASFSSGTAVQAGKVVLFPVDFSLEGYKTVFNTKTVWIGFANSLFYTFVGTAINVAMTMTAGYCLSRKDLPGRNGIMLLFTFTMFFSGGLIPTYLLINNLGLLDSMWAVILPGAFSVWNMIIARTYYQGIPRELREAADVDGASEMLYFFKILLPVCMPVVAVLALWQFVAMWNSYFDAMIYLNSASKQPLQLVLRSILIQSQPESGMIADIQSTAERAKMAELLKYATIIISSLPLLVMYPFFQKYFDAGIMAGSIKG